MDDRMGSGSLVGRILSCEHREERALFQQAASNQPTSTNINPTSTDINQHQPPTHQSITKQVAKAPDGNGGLYRALHTSGALDKMTKAGVEAIDVYCVDNSLSRLGDPEFVGACYSQGAEVGLYVFAGGLAVGFQCSRCAQNGEGMLSCLTPSWTDHPTDPIQSNPIQSDPIHSIQVGARVLAKAYPEEKVGVFAYTPEGKLQVGGFLFLVDETAQ